MKNLLRTIIVLLSCCIIFTGTARAAVKVDFVDIDPEDVDILVGEFSSLVKAFKKFATDEDSTLELRINQVFSEFDKSMDCTLDKAAVKAINTYERMLAPFDFILKGKAYRACKSATLMDGGSGGLLDRYIFDNCMLKEIIRKKPVDLMSVKSGYSGLKEVANASYCKFKKSEDSEEHKDSKKAFSTVSILISAYGDLSRMEGCNVSYPSTLYRCTKGYYNSHIKLLKQFSTNDTMDVRFDDLNTLRNDITPPEINTKWLYWEEQDLSREQLEQYEDLIVSLRRSVEIATLSNSLRTKKYNKRVPKNSKLIKSISASLDRSNNKLGKQYLKCSNWVGGYCSKLKWSSFSNYIAPLDKAIQLCRPVVTDKSYDDLVTSEEKSMCTTGANAAKKRITEILAYFSKRDAEQIRSVIYGRPVPH